DRRGVAKVIERIDVAAADATKAAHTIEQLDLAHRRGFEPDTLSYANAAVTEVQVWSGGRSQSTVEVRRPGLNARTLTPPIDGEGRGGRGGGGGGGGGPAPRGGGGAGAPRRGPADEETRNPERPAA